jgi:hypothetical protein
LGEEIASDEDDQASTLAEEASRESGSEFWFEEIEKAYNAAMPEEPEAPETKEALELSETLKEATERGGHSLTSVSIILSAMSILGPLLLILSHRAQNTVAIYEAKASDEWLTYSMRLTRSSAAAQELDLLTLLSPETDSAKTDSPRKANMAKTIQTLNDHLEKWRPDLTEKQEAARDSSEQADRARGQIDRITVGQAILQIGLLMASITLYTRKRLFLVLGVIFGAVGVSVALLATFFP